MQARRIQTFESDSDDGYHLDDYDYHIDIQNDITSLTSEDSKSTTANLHDERQWKIEKSIEERKWEDFTTTFEQVTGGMQPIQLWEYGCHCFQQTDRPQEGF